MPMEDIQLDGGHSVEISFEDIQRHEMPADIDHQPAPGKARLVTNGNCGNCKALGSDLDKLEKRFETSHCSKRGWSIDFCAARSNLQRIGFVFSQFLNGLPGLIGMDYKGCMRRVNHFQIQRGESQLRS